MNNQLTVAFTEEEVKTALNQMHPLKNPRPDGTPALFFSQFWPTVQHDVLAIVLGILNDALSPKHINQTFITLIPKKKALDSPKDFRPISLCNVIFKLVTKCIANRLKIILPLVISKTQSIFTLGRLITDNALLAFELFHSMKTNKSPRLSTFALKLDMSKAYDRVEWSFLDGALSRLGFCRPFVNLVMRCVSTVSYSILINGQPSNHFIPSSGLRQGDPLSPYLFLCCAEAFSALIYKAENCGSLHGVRICRRAPPISHLFFADDNLIFGSATQEEIEIVRGILLKYSGASGQRINFDKSEIAFSCGLNSETTVHLGALCRVSVVPQHSIYLGLPATFGRSKNEIFRSIKDRVAKKHKDWKVRSLSQAGKMVLIKAVAQSIPNYIMSCFFLPRSVIHRLDQMIANFWWGQKDGKKIHWCSWDMTCSSKRFGGLGFRDFDCFNRALLAKQGWRILTNPNSLLSSYLRARYFPHSTFLEASLGHSPSFAWRSILMGRYVLTLGLCWTIRNGRTTRIREDPWISSLPGFKISSLPGNFRPNQNVCDLMVSSGKEWNATAIHSLFPLDVARAIMSIPLSFSHQIDCLQWVHSKNGRYSVKSGYWVAKNSKDVLSSKPSSSFNNHMTWSWIWSLNIPPKVKIFIWRCMRGILQTKRNLNSRGINVDPICSRCGLAVESLKHVLRDCRWSTFFWKVSVLRLECSSTNQNIPVQDWILALSRHKNPEFGCTFAILLWMNWKARNLLEFQRHSLSFQNCFDSALGLLFEFPLHNSPAARSSTVRNSNYRWSPPPSGWLKMNSDASILSDGVAGLGGVIRNCQGKVIRAFVKSSPFCPDVPLAEALACRLGVQAILETGATAFLVEIDNQDVIHMLNHDTAPPSPVGTVIADIISMVRNCPQVSFQWTRRSANCLAHRIARHACNPSFSIDSVDSFPDSLRRIVTADFAPS